jgi:hypothetical protein
MVESASHGPTTLLAIRWASTSTPRNGSPVTPSGWPGCVGYGPTSSLLISTVGPVAAPDSFTAEPSTAVEHAAESSATETNAIYTSRIRKNYRARHQIRRTADAVSKSIQGD